MTSSFSDSLKCSLWSPESPTYAWLFKLFRILYTHWLFLITLIYVQCTNNTLDVLHKNLSWRNFCRRNACIVSFRTRSDVFEHKMMIFRAKVACRDWNAASQGHVLVRHFHDLIAHFDNFSEFNFVRLMIFFLACCTYQNLAVFKREP